MKPIFKKEKLIKSVEYLIFNIRWILIIPYLTLFGALLVYVFYDITEFIDYCLSS